MAQRIPAQHTAGDTFTGTLSHADHPASGGWVASMLLVGHGGARYTVASTAAGDEHTLSATAAITANWRSGDYAAIAVYAKSATSARSTYPLGGLRVHPDPAARGTCADDLKGPARRAYDDLQAAYRAYLAAGRWTVQEYMIAGRRMTFRSVPELLQAIDRARREAEAEDAASAIASGLSGRQRLVVRM